MARSGHDPIAKFIRWLNDARRARFPNYEAIALATAARSGKISVRFVLLKGIDERGFVFFTDARSRKGHELRNNPRASFAQYWQPKGRQVRVEGHVEEVTSAEADAYWATRPRQSQLAASASHQSARLRSRAEILARFARLTRKFVRSTFDAVADGDVICSSHRWYQTSTRRGPMALLTAGIQERQREPSGVIRLDHVKCA
jgi:pyridoxamine 5'-phosphate oxidase